MKPIWRRTFAAGLSLSLLLSQGAMASEALGHDLHETTLTLSQGTSVTRELFWSDTYSDLRTGQYLTYTPNAGVSPAVVYGRESVLNKATLTNLAKTREEQGKRVVGGVNGDFYVVATGQPLGLVVTGGVVRSSSSYHYAVGFRADGTAFIGQPGLTVAATMGEERVAVTGGVNKIRQLTGKDNGGLLLLTGDFGATTQNTSAGVDVILRPLANQEQVVEPLPPLETPAGELPEPTGIPEAAEEPSAGEGEAPADVPSGETETPAGEEPQTGGETSAEGEPPVEREPWVDPGAGLPRSPELKINSRTRCLHHRHPRGVLCPHHER